MRKVSRRGVAAGRAEGKSLCARLAPSSGAQGSNGIQRRKRRPRMDKQEREFRRRVSGNRVVEATVLDFKGAALPTASTGSGIEGRIPPVDLWTCATEARKEFKMN
jgi:hypothetical protein